MAGTKPKTATKTRATSSPAKKTKAGGAASASRAAKKAGISKAGAVAKGGRAAKAPAFKATRKAAPVKAVTPAKKAAPTKKGSPAARRSTARAGNLAASEPVAAPAAPTRSSKAPAARRPSKPPGPTLPRAFASPKDVQILVVDDEPEVLNLLVPFLKKRGYSVNEAEDGDQALEKILTDRPHVVLLDVMMPGLNGWEIARYVRDREELDGVRIVMATGIGEEMNAATAPLHGADAYLDKPFRLDDVERIILEVLSRLDRGELGR